MNVLLCCIARMENRYIREWVEYNKNVGFTNICLYDNNHDGEQDFRDVIGDYIDSGYVILKDYRNKTVCQLEAYTECYAEYGDEYDWIAFFDSDKFITLPFHANISNYLSEKIFDNFFVVRINWALYGDNDMLYDDGRPVLERFKYPIPVYQITHGNIESTTYKSIIRGGQHISQNENDGGFEFITPHTVNLYPVCNNAGKEVECTNQFISPSYELACLRHYSTKTAREYCNKILRSFPDNSAALSAEYLIKNCFFTTNDVTPEKVQIFKDVLGVDVSYLLK